MTDRETYEFDPLETNPYDLDMDEQGYEHPGDEL